MPLIANHLAPAEHRDEPVTVEQSDTEGMDDMSYESRDSTMEEPNDKMEASLKAPGLALGSEKRVSVLLEGVMMDLQNIDVPGNEESEVAKRLSMVSMASNPHDMYLSSEEDASESADEDDGSLLEFDGNGEPVSPAMSRRSQEATARVVSITLVTKPQIVEISTHSNHSCRGHSAQSSIDSTTQRLDPVVSRRRSNRSSSLSISRRYSIASTISSLISSQAPTSASAHPPRKSSKLAGLPSLTRQTQPMLANDPFSAPDPADRSYPPLIPEWDRSFDAPERAQTSLSRPTSAWKRGVKTLSRARYPSMPKMNLAYKTGATIAGDLRAARAAAKEEREEMIKENEVAQAPRPISAVPVEKVGPVRYEDILRTAIKAPSPPPPPPPSRGLKASIFGGKRKSLNR
ncbi:hypothetical protein F5884DRAFT_465791 [Xylogone sp. PMI_703]|nr:hypothetical protein F5884DRAFT_465791 [Xylogone sp. PMI_703]